MRKNLDSSSNKISGINIIIISIVSFLYVLMITKLAEIISSQYYTDGNENMDEYENGIDNKVGVYVMIIYFVSIIGIIIGYVWFSDYDKSLSNQTPNWIVRWSLSVGGVLMLIYTITNYWEYLNDYCKLLLIFLSITSIIYYLYKYY